MTITRIALFAATAAVLSSPAFADKVNMKAELKSASEVAANDSKGTGAVTATYDTATKQLTWNGTYAGLTGPVLMAHFHGPAEPGKNAGVALNIGEFKDGKLGGTATLTDAQAADLLAGRWYVNIHTEKNKAGEIRGQVMK